MNPKISLILPVYNASPFVAEAIQSIKEQTLDSKDFEVIILDDCSIDTSKEVILDSINGMKNIRFISNQKNLGTSGARNKAIESADSNLITLLDADDLLEPTALESTLKFIQSNPNVKYSYSMHKRVDTSGKFICNRQGYPYSKRRLLHFNFVGPLKCFDRELHNAIGGYERGNSVEDWDHVLKASELLGETQIKQNKEFLYLYRIHGMNNTIANINKVRASAVKTLDNALKRRGINAKARFSHKTTEGYSYYTWEKK